MENLGAAVCRRRIGARGGIPHQRAYRLGAANEAIHCPSRSSREERDFGRKRVKRDKPILVIHREPALQRVRGRGSGRGARTLRGLPDDEART